MHHSHSPTNFPPDASSSHLNATSKHMLSKATATAATQNHPRPQLSTTLQSQLEPVMVAHICDPRTQAETVESIVQSQPGLYSEITCQNKWSR